MKVTFTKTDGARYSVAITHENGPELVTRQAPGYDEYMPHDLAHFLVEEQFGLRLGVFGQLAAGGEGIFAPAPQDRSGRTRRTAHRAADTGRADMERSERLVTLCQPLWEIRSGRKPAVPAVVDMTLATPFQVDRMMYRFDEIAERWHALEPGESLTLEWPKALTFNTGGSSEGRRSQDRSDRRVRAGAR